MINRSLIRRVPSVLMLIAGTWLQSCIKGELAVPAHEPGAVTTATVDIGPGYEWQLYYDLETNTVVGKSLKNSWDLGFETSEQGSHLVLNTGLSMFAYRTGKTDMQEVQISDTTGKKSTDSPGGSLDSTAIGDWQDGNDVYIINRGYDGATHRGFVKVQFLSVDKGKYVLRYAAMDGSDEHTIEIGKDENYNLAFCSFTTGGAVSVEPLKDKWDIVFTQYTHIYYDMGNIPYLVTGCLLNRNNTAAATDTIHAFDIITHEETDGYTFSSELNTIGFDWKTYTGSTYVTNPGISYIIRNREGQYFKLHFIDFLNSLGVKGNPKWEYQKL